MVEYSLLVALIAVIAIVAVRTVGGANSGTMSYNATMISKAMCEAWGGTSC